MIKACNVTIELSYNWHEAYTNWLSDKALTLRQLRDCNWLSKWIQGRHDPSLYVIINCGSGIEIIPAGSFETNSAHWRRQTCGSLMSRDWSSRSVLAKNTIAPVPYLANVLGSAVIPGWCSECELLSLFCMHCLNLGMQEPLSHHQWSIYARSGQGHYILFPFQCKEPFQILFRKVWWYLDL